MLGFLRPQKTVVNSPEFTKLNTSGSSFLREAFWVVFEGKPKRNRCFAGSPMQDTLCARILKLPLVGGQQLVVGYEKIPCTRQLKPSILVSKLCVKDPKEQQKGQKGHWCLFGSLWLKIDGFHDFWFGSTH